MSLFAARQGQERIDSLLKELPKAKEDTNRVKLLNAISFMYYAYDPATGIRYGNDGLRLATRLDDKQGMAVAYNSIGANYQMQANNNMALECYMKAAKLNEEVGNRKIMAQNMGNIGIIYYSESNYAKALEYLFKVLGIFEELKDKKGIVVQLGNIGAIYDEQKNYAKALEYDSMALVQYRQFGDRENEAMLLGNIGNVNNNMGNLDTAVQNYLASMKIYTALGNKDGQARTLSNVSMIYAAKKDHHKAIQCQVEALRLGNELGNQITISQADVNLSNYYMDIVNQPQMPPADSLIPGSRAACLKLAIGYAQKGVEVGFKAGNLKVVSNAYKALAEAQAASNDHKSALASTNLYWLYKDSVFNKENNIKISSLEQQRELALRESKIELLTKDNKLKDLKADKETLTRRILVIGIVMVILLSFSVVMYYVRKQRNEKLIAQEKMNTLLKEEELRSVNNMLEVQEDERKRIAADLHDRLGSMLSTVKLYFNSVEEHIAMQNQGQYHKATSLLDDACDEVRKISHNLASGELAKFGLVSALSQMKNTISDTGKLKINMLAFGMEGRLDSNTEISLYRVVQEVMNNILKHAQATEVTIQLNKTGNELNVVIEDNGVGFDVTTAMVQGGMGLKSMETRVRKLNGKISFDSGKGQGTTTIIDIPV